MFIDSLGLDYRTIRSGLAMERTMVAAEFNNPRSSVRVLITAYAVGGLGLNLYGACARAILVELALNISLQLQAIGRIYQLGLIIEQKAWILFMKYTINRWFEFDISYKVRSQIAINIAESQVLQQRVEELKTETPRKLMTDKRKELPEEFVDKNHRDSLKPRPYGTSLNR